MLVIGLKEILTKSLQGYFVALAFLEKYFCKHLAILAFSDFRIFRTKWAPESETDTSSSIIKGKAEIASNYLYGKWTQVISTYGGNLYQPHFFLGD